MAKRNTPTMYALVTVNKVLVPVEQLGMFESCMQLETAYNRDEAGQYTETKYISEQPKLPSVELVSMDQVVAWQVAGKMQARK